MKQEQYKNIIDRLKAVTIHAADLKNYIKPISLQVFFQDLFLLSSTDHTDAPAFLNLVNEKLDNYPILDTLVEISKSDILLKFDPTEKHQKRDKDTLDDVRYDQAVITIGNEIIDIVKDLKERYPELKKTPNE